VLCLDDSNVQAIITRVERRIITYGTSNQADLVASRIEYRDFGCSYQMRYHGNPLGSVALQIPGQHSVLNSLAAVAIGLELEIPVEKIIAALGAFQNADRRFQIKGDRGGILVVDDYGHHPTEIMATLSAARSSSDRRIVAVFQPHRYTRAQALGEEFALAFNNADVVIVLPIYAAGEDPIAGVTAIDLADRIKKHGHRDVTFAPDFPAALRILRERLQAADLLLTLGAGDVWKIGEQWLGDAAV